MDVMLVVDMQVGLLNGDPKHDLTPSSNASTGSRQKSANSPARSSSSSTAAARATTSSRKHLAGRCFPNLIATLPISSFEKTLNDPFAGTELAARLKEIAPDRVFITGWATDFCVDATVRSAVSNHHNVVVVADAHTLNDRPHLDAASVIRHHNWVWSKLITRRSIRLARTDELLR